MLSQPTILSADGSDSDYTYSADDDDEDGINDDKKQEENNNKYNNKKNKDKKRDKKHHHKKGGKIKPKGKGKKKKKHRGGHNHNNNNPKKLEECTMENMVYILREIVIKNRNSKCYGYKKLIIRYFVENKIDGKKFISMHKKNKIVKKLAEYIDVNNTKIYGLVNELVLEIANLDLNAKK